MTRNSPPFWNERQVAKFLKYVDRAGGITGGVRGREYGFTPLPLVIWVGFATGLRLGELLALEWPDYDFDDGVLTVAKKLTPGGAIDQFVKSVASNRRIELSGPVRDRLRAWKKEQAAERLAAGSRWVPLDRQHSGDEKTDFIFTMTNGKLPSCQSFEEWFDQRVGSSGLSLRLTPHGMRHSHAAILLQSAGWPMEHVSRRLGHASVSVTDYNYGHIDTTMAPRSPRTFWEALDDAREADGGEMVGNGTA